LSWFKIIIYSDRIEYNEYGVVLRIYVNVIHRNELRICLLFCIELKKSYLRIEVIEY